MTPREFINLNTEKRVEKVCTRAKTTVGNFKQIALWGGGVSAALARRLEAASNGDMTVTEILFPDEDEQMIEARERRQSYGTIRANKAS